MTRKLAVVTLFAAFAASCAGCSRLFGEGAALVTGAKGVYAPHHEIESADPTPLSEYGKYELGEVKDGFAGQVPDELFTHLPGKFREQLGEKKLTGRTGKTLRIRGEIFYYESASLFGHAFGPFEQAVARFELVDKASGEVLGSAYCVGRSDKTAAQGVEHKADGLAKAIASWIADRTFAED